MSGAWRHRCPLLVAAGLALLLVAWVFATPAWDGPDESAHYLRALTLTHGQLLGPKTGMLPSNRAAIRQGGPFALQQLFLIQDQRNVRVPARLSPPNVPCVNGRPNVTGSCVESSYEGNFPPLGYVLPAAALATAHTQSSGLWRAREASALETLAFLLIMFALAGWRAGWLTVGLLAALPPGAINIGSLLGPSGVEIAANLAFLAALLKLRREGTAFPRWAWVALAVSGATTILAWQLGPIFAAFDVFAVILLGGRTWLTTLAHAQRRPVLLAVAVLVAAAILFLIYGQVSDVLHSNLRFHPLIQSLRDGYYQTRAAIDGGVGSFASGQVALSQQLDRVWEIGVLALLLGALIRGTMHERVALIVVSGLAAAFPILFYAFSLRSSGFGLQGRHVLPVLAVLPVMAGEILDRHSTQSGRVSRPLAALALAGIAAYQFVAWWKNAHFFAGGSAASTFLRHTVWSPPFGWTPWLAAAMLGTLSLVAGAALNGLVARRPSGRQA